MKDFFIVSHKYATNIVVDIVPNLSTKAWHLNDVIKKIVIDICKQAEPLNTDNVVNTLFNSSAGLNNGNSDTTDNE